MVTRRRTLTSSPSSDSSNEPQQHTHPLPQSGDYQHQHHPHMAVDILRKVPLHYQSGLPPLDDELDDVALQNPEDWEQASPTRHLSGSSSSSSSFDFDQSPPRIAQVIHVPRTATTNISRPLSNCVESQQRDDRDSCRSLSSASGGTNGNSSLFMIGLVLIGMVAAILSRSSVNFAVQRVSQLASVRDSLTNDLYKTESDLHSLKRQLMAMNALIQQQQEVGVHASPSEANKRMALNELNALQNRIKELNYTDKNLKERVQELSRDEINRKFGPGKKYVEMELVFPDVTTSKPNGPTKFIIELATVEMPHSAHTFLEMTSAGLIDGCSFILNSMNVLKAAPLPYDGSLASLKAKEFAAHGLESVTFKEYNKSYPHKKYTVGFAADGSPSFYINTEDNTDFHFGDPCFGKIVDGIDTIHRLESAPTRNGIWFAKKIGIKHAKILDKDPFAPPGKVGHKEHLRPGGSNSRD